MKTVCLRCKNTINYEKELPEKCPFCGATYIFAEKTEIEKKRDTDRLHLPEKLKNVSPASKKRKFLIPLSILIDLSWIAVGLIMALLFYKFPYPLSVIFPWLGTAFTLGALYRLVYRATMLNRIKKAVISGITEVDSLITALALKTKSDVLSLFKKAVKWGFLTGYGARNGTEIYKSND